MHARGTLKTNEVTRISPSVLFSLLGLSVISTAFFWAGAVANHNWQFAYLIWNLFLAWTPVICTMLVLRLVATRSWTSFIPVVVSVVWLLVLPNSFYMITDFVHIQEVPRHNLTYDIVMFTSFIVTAVLLGYVSVRAIHAELRKRASSRDSWAIVSFVFLLCSFAIYLGRDLRWNSWDVLINPAGILFDVSDHVLHPLAHGDMFSTTASFFVLLLGLYIAGRHITAPGQ